MKPTLVIMAAGMGSRYGGLKQIDPVGPGGETIMEYSIYDAAKAGFGKVVFIIKEEFGDVFKERFGDKVSKAIEVAYVFQKTDALPAGFSLPDGREKPWGTGHAVLCCKDAVTTPFAVINADDFYGFDTFRCLAAFLTQSHDESSQYQYAMVGFNIMNTLTENGHVARGVCQTDGDNNLVDIIERTRIEKFGDAVKYTTDGEVFTELPPSTTVSMNTWGFTPSIFSELASRFPQFLLASKDNILQAEFFLPNVVGELIKEHKAHVRVLPTSEKWYGVTYKEDRPAVVAAVADKTKAGAYPSDLWD